MSVFRSLVLLFVVAIFCDGPRAFAADRNFPDQIDPAKRYIFYLHGVYVEKHGPNKRYKYADILDAIEAKGFVVIGEVRPPSDIRDYADGIAVQVAKLLDAGVPEKNITIAGHSKGAMIALTSASKIQRRNLSYGVFGGCGVVGSPYRRSYEKFIHRSAQRLQGRFLIMWAADDDVTGPCNEAMEKAGVEFENVKLPAGKGGHSFFQKPDPLWINRLFAFANGE